MAVVGVADQYMIMMAITLLFTVLALAYDENKLLGLLAALSWFLSALGHFSMGDKTSALTWGLAWLFVGIGLLFTIETIIKTARLLREKRYGTTEL